jgi:hypothetical protein
MTRSTSARSSSSLSRPVRKASIGDIPSIFAQEQPKRLGYMVS